MKTIDLLLERGADQYLGTAGPESLCAVEIAMKLIQQMKSGPDLNATSEEFKAKGAIRFARALKVAHRVTGNTL